ncbi:hypothetical protein CSE_00850 [Caldisericum exile AZM16c01]|uniref:Uncharacterized protein n=1 Tax=Caldisericum exile (strain DSM 21853 / NBRC 104410 / AZM16c01) TaxID=511051 RepID=A0A7U6JE03_CALEA|nr:hypothetical protein CSE_00850 [Caldisericum exile AZM16c01]
MTFWGVLRGAVQPLKLRQGSEVKEVEIGKKRTKSERKKTEF